jgi:SAM-dependent methyltransferase
MKSTLKYIFQLTNTLKILDKLIFLKAKIANRKKNIDFRRENQCFNLPPDYFLHETYMLNYKQYKSDGFLTAKELTEWTKEYLPETKYILEWGSGVSRIIRHFDNFINTESKLFGCDINKEMIDWSKNNIANVQFDQISYYPPTIYADNSFDFIYGISVFTHIEVSIQETWINEISRIIKKNGIFLFTTHGTYYSNKLTLFELQELKKKGAYTIPFNKEGHRMMTTFNDRITFENKISIYFEVLKFYEGKNHLEKIGGQDLWIVKRK